MRSLHSRGSPVRLSVTCSGCSSNQPCNLLPGEQFNLLFEIRKARYTRYGYLQTPCMAAVAYWLMQAGPAFCWLMHATNDDSLVFAYNADCPTDVLSTSLVSLAATEWYIAAQATSQHKPLNIVKAGCRHTAHGTILLSSEPSSLPPMHQDRRNGKATAAPCSGSITHRTFTHDRT